MNHLLSNVTLSLRFLKSQGVDLTNIGASDVVCGNPRLVLGLVWRIMLYSFAQDLGDKDYQVSQHGLLLFVYFEIRSHSLSRGSVQGVFFNSFILFFFIDPGCECGQTQKRRMAQAANQTLRSGTSNHGTT